MTHDAPTQLPINPEAEKAARRKIIEVVNKMNQRLQHFARHHVPLNYQIMKLIEGMPVVRLLPSLTSCQAHTDYHYQLYEHYSYINTCLQSVHCSTIAKEWGYLDAGREEIDEAIAEVVEGIDRYRELYGLVGDNRRR